MIDKLTSRQQSILHFLTTFAITTLLVIYTYELDWEHLSIPLIYVGDALDKLVTIESILSRDLYGTLFAPFEISHDYSAIYHFTSVIFAPLWVWIIQLFSWFTDDAVFVVNAYFYLTYPLTALSMVFLLRYLKVNPHFAIAIGILYAFLPYHQFRATGHLVNGSYFLIPLYCLITFWLFQRVPPFFCSSNGRLKFQLNRKAFFCIVVLLVLSPTSYYYSFLVAIFFVLAGGYASFHRKTWVNLQTTLILLALVLGSLLKQPIPEKLEKLANPEFAEAVEQVKPGQNISTYGQVEVYGLKITQLLLPIENHRIDALAEATAHYNSSNPLVNENESAALGIFGAVSLLFLLALLLTRQRDFSLPRYLSILTLTGILFATIGGFSSLMSWLASAVSPDSMIAQARSFNRVSVFLACFAYVAMGLWLTHRTRHLGGYANSAIAAAILLVGILDVIPDRRGKPNSHLQNLDYFLADKAYFEVLERNLDTGARVFQWPHHVHHQNLTYHENYVGKILTEDIVWSFGADKDSRQNQWAESVAVLPGPQMVRELRKHEFAGILVDRQLAGDEFLPLMKQLQFLPRPMVSTHQRWVYLSIEE